MLIEIFWRGFDEFEDELKAIIASIESLFGLVDELGRVPCP